MLSLFWGNIIILSILQTQMLPPMKQQVSKQIFTKGRKNFYWYLKKALSTNDLSSWKCVEVSNTAKSEIKYINVSKGSYFCDMILSP